MNRRGPPAPSRRNPKETHLSTETNQHVGWLEYDGLDYIAATLLLYSPVGAEVQWNDFRSGAIWQAFGIQDVEVTRSTDRKGDTAYMFGGARCKLHTAPQPANEFEKYFIIKWACKKYILYTVDANEFDSLGVEELVTSAGENC